MNLFSDTLDSLFKWLCQKSREADCFPHIIKATDKETFCVKCKKQFKSIIKERIKL